MRYASISFVVCLLMSILTACNRTQEKYTLPTFPKQTTATVATFGSVMTNVVYGIEALGDTLMVVGYRDGKYVHLHDKQSGKLLSSGVSSGRAANEILSISGYTWDAASQQLVINDAQQGVVKSFAISDNCALKYQIELPQRGATGAYKLNNDSFVTFNTNFDANGNHRLCLINNGSVVDSSNYCPIDSPDLATNVYIQPRIAISPNGEHLAIGTLYGGVLELYSLSSNNISHMATRRFIEPKIMDATLSAELGFVYMTATKDYIFTITNGFAPLAEPLNRIMIFDWEGQPKHQITTDVALAAICVDADGDIYCISQTSEDITLGKLTD